MKRSLVLLLPILLTACGGSVDFLKNPGGVGIPSATSARFYYDETTSGAKNADNVSLSAGEYLIASFSHTNAKCHEFFEALEKYRQDSDFIDKVITAGVAAGSPLLGLVGASGSAVARFTSGLSLANQTNKYASDIYAFATFREQLKDHVFDSMSTFQKGRGLDLLPKSQIGLYIDGSDETVDTFAGSKSIRRVSLTTGDTIRVDVEQVREFLASTKPIHLIIARDIATDYAAKCSLANMKKIVVRALNATRTVSEAGGLGSPSTDKTEAKEQISAEVAVRAADEAKKSAQRANTAAAKAQRAAN